MSLAERIDDILDVGYQNMKNVGSSNEIFAHDDPWYMPKDSLSWIANDGRHYFITDIGEEHDRVAYLIYENRRLFPDLYESL